MNSEWQWRPLRELTLRAPVWNPRTDPRPTIRYVDVSAISRDEFRIVSHADHKGSDAPSRARKLVKFNDTIFATVRPTLRRIAQVPATLDDELVSTAFCVLRPNLEIIHPDYLFFAVQLQDVMAGIDAVQTGASYPAVRDQDVLDQSIPVPPLSDQLRIVSILNRIRSAMLIQRQSEEAAQALKRAAMRQLFTRGLRGEPQKETDIGPLPESWSVKSIGNITNIVYRYPSYYRIGYTSSGIPEVRGELLNASGEIESDLSRFRFIDSETAERFPKVRLEVDDIVMSVRGTMGKIGLAKQVHKGAVITANLIRLAPDRTQILPAYFKAVLMSDRFQNALEMASPQTTIKTITAPVLRSLRLPTPNQAEQQEIVAILDAIDRKIWLHRRKRDVLDELFNSLLHKLMTGEVRVGELELSSIPVP